MKPTLYKKNKEYFAKSLLKGHWWALYALSSHFTKQAFKTNDPLIFFFFFSLNLQAIFIKKCVQKALFALHPTPTQFGDMQGSIQNIVVKCIVYKLYLNKKQGWK